MSALAASIEVQADLPRTARRVEPAQRLRSDAEVLEAAQRGAEQFGRERAEQAGDDGPQQHRLPARDAEQALQGGAQAQQQRGAQGHAGWW
ncbi:hypothetical protein [Variovorax paradoxus]|uniref:hypothetical protein n=1 Tax=Variovorax paradoxus TaxID=34073 RepID=UPI001ABCE392